MGTEGAELCPLQEASQPFPLFFSVDFEAIDIYTKNIYDKEG